jgi:hypothetical protein
MHSFGATVLENSITTDTLTPKMKDIIIQYSGKILSYDELLHLASIAHFESEDGRHGLIPIGMYGIYTLRIPILI